jgi:hypothetical protein
VDAREGRDYSTPITQRVLAVFCGDLPLHDPGDRAKIFAVDDLIPNSLVIANGVLHVWLEDGSDPNQSAMRIARDLVVSLRDCHHTTFDGLTVEFGFNGSRIRVTPRITSPCAIA